MENISIRARVAYGILCLESLINFFQLDKNKWEFVLKELWKYTNSNVGRWHEVMSEIIPFSVCEEIDFQEKGCVIINEQTHNQLKDIYSEVNQDLLAIIDLVFEIGTRDLYSTITNKSQDTLLYIQKINTILNKYKIDPPNYRIFEKYSISENNGWGIEFTRDDIFNLE
jgi:hypothetical protein